MEPSDIDLEQKPNIFQRAFNVLKNVTVEPVAFLMMSASLFASTATQTLALEKACRVNLNLSEAICDAVRAQNTTDNGQSEREIQAYVANLIAYKSIITSVLPCILLVFAGGWMDVTGRRKIIMLLSVIGENLVQINNIVNVIFFDQLRVEILIFLEAIFGSIFGAWSLLFLAVYSYIVDVTTEEDRTYRVGLVAFAVVIGMPIGTSLSGVVLKNFGYLAVFITTLSMALLNAFYIMFVLSDPARTKEHKKHDNRGIIYFLKTFFDPSHLINSLKVVFKKTDDNRALRLCILIGTTCFIFLPMYGEHAIMYMSTRYRFSWDELQYSTFKAYNLVVSMCGTMLCVVVISKILGWNDSVIGILSTGSKIGASFVYAFAKTGTAFYLGPAIDILDGNASMAMRSIFSKNVEPHEIAKLNSIVGIFEVVMPIASVPAYTRIYTATISVMPGFVFLLSAVLTVPALLVFIWLFIRHLRSDNRLEKVRQSSPGPEEIVS